MIAHRIGKAFDARRIQHLHGNPALLQTRRHAQDAERQENAFIKEEHGRRGDKSYGPGFLIHRRVISTSSGLAGPKISSAARVTPG